MIARARRSTAEAVVNFGRNHLDAKGIAIIVQLGMLLWGAAAFYNRTEANAAAIATLKAEVDGLDGRQDEFEKRLDKGGIP